MKSSSATLFASLFSSVLASQPLIRAACKADNCARAVTGTALPSASRSAHFADCQSYFACSVTSGFGGSAASSCPTSIPSYASACSGAVRYSSACSCYGATAATATVTPGPTTIVTPSPTPTADCTSIPADIQGPEIEVNYVQYFTGSGVTENPNNPGNEFQAPITAQYDGSLSKCDAAGRCAYFAGLANYFSFDLHKTLTGDKKWECVLYFNSNNDASYFNIRNSTVGETYGYNAMSQ